MSVHCDFCEQTAELVVESLDGERAYLCREHRRLVCGERDWFEPAVLACEIDPRSGLPLVA